MKFNNFFDAFHFLDEHPIFQGRFQYGCCDIMVMKVNPNTKEVDDNRELNTETNVWLEAGPYEDGHTVHDWEIDCGGDTYEEAIIELANNVFNKYGGYHEDDAVDTFTEFRMTPSERTYLQDTVSILEDYDGEKSVDGLKALVDETKDRVIKVLKHEVDEEDSGISS